MMQTIVSIILILFAVNCNAVDRCDTDVHPDLGVKGSCMEIKDCDSIGGTYLHNWCMSEAKTIKCCFKEEEIVEEQTVDEVVEETTDSNDEECEFPSNFNRCNGIIRGFVAHPDPTKYIMCFNGIQVMLDCPVGTVWDEDKSICEKDDPLTYGELEDFFLSFLSFFDNIDDAESDQCNHSEFGAGKCMEMSECPGLYVHNYCPNQPTSVKCCFENISWDNICSKGGQLYPHQDPTKFIHCAHGFPFIKDCPSGQIWISEKQWCDWA